MDKFYRPTGNISLKGEPIPIKDDFISPSESLTQPQFECSTIGCPHVTFIPYNDDPKLRWIIGFDATDETTGEPIKVNFCPKCIDEFMDLDDDFFKSLKRTESKLRDGSITEAIHTAGR